MTINKIMNTDISNLTKIVGVDMSNLSKFMGTGMPTYEDFTTYTEVDEDSDITVTQFEIDCVTMRRDAVSYVRKDFGASYFGDFEVEFGVYLGLCNGSGLVTCFALSNGANTFQQRLDSNDGLDVTYQDVQFPQNRIIVTEYEAGVNQDYYNTDFSLWRYITASRINNQFYVKIYSDSGRNTLLDTLQVTCGTTAYRYCYVLTSRDSSALGADTASAKITNLRIVSH